MALILYALQIVLFPLPSFEAIWNQRAGTDAPDWKLWSHLQIDKRSLTLVLHIFKAAVDMQSVFVVGIS